jgi:nucleotide-binding universal stress UspA family protein
MFKKIVVGLDGSDHSENALRVACDIGGKYGSEIHLVHTPHPETAAFAMGAVAGYHAVTTMPSAEEVKASADKILSSGEAIAKECGSEITQKHIKTGNAADEILACAEGCGADLIITGRRGLGSVGGLLQGSITQRVGHQAKCACLSVL